MSIIDHIFIREIVQSLGWTLFHSLWQGGVLALLLKIILTLSTKKSAATHYIFSCLVLFSILVISAITIWKVTSSKNSLSDSPQNSYSSISVIAHKVEDNAANGSYLSIYTLKNISVRWLDAALPWLLCCWFIGIMILSSRMVNNWIKTLRLKHKSVRPLEKRWHDKLNKLAKTIHLAEPIQLLESSLVQVPAVVGWLRPAILIPENTVENLSLEQMEAIMAHELAHIKRYDYIINLFQKIIEILYFYHPAIWWISNNARILREHACDDMALEVCGDKITYARALTQIEYLRKSSSPKFAMAANGGSLLNRIKRLLEPPPVSQANGAAALLVCLITVLTVMTVGAVTQNSFSPDREVRSDNSNSQRNIQSVSGDDKNNKVELSHSQTDGQGNSAVKSKRVKKQSNAGSSNSPKLPNEVVVNDELNRGSTDVKTPVEKQERKPVYDIKTLERLVDLGNKSLDLMIKAQQMTNGGTIENNPSKQSTAVPAPQSGTSGQSASPQLKKIDSLVDLGNKSMDLYLKMMTYTNSLSDSDKNISNSSKKQN